MGFAASRRRASSWDNPSSDTSGMGSAKGFPGFARNCLVPEAHTKVLRSSAAENHQYLYHIPEVLVRFKPEQKTHLLFCQNLEMVCAQMPVSVSLPVCPVLLRAIPTVSFPLY